MPGSSDAGPRELSLLAQACLIDRRSPRTRDSWIMAALPTLDQPDREVLAGIIERVTFHNAETGFCVLRVKARGHRDLATVVGHSATISAGDGSPRLAIGSTIARTGSSSRHVSCALQLRARLRVSSGISHRA